MLEASNMTILMEMRRRNVFKVASVYLVTSWVLLQIISVIAPALNLPPAFLTISVVVLGLSFPIACIFAWAFELTHDGLKRTDGLDESELSASSNDQKLNYAILTALIIAVCYIGYDFIFNNIKDDPLSYSSELVELNDKAPAAAINKTRNAAADGTKEKIYSLAVLPFINMSDDSSQEYFVDGLTEELLNSLARVESLKLTARTSSFAFKGQNIDIREIATKLDVQYLIEGSVRKSGEDIRVSVQLIEASSGTHLLSDTFDRKLVNVFTLQEELSEQIAAALRLTLVHDDDRYKSTVEKLDYIAVEKLVTARGLSNDHSEESYIKAINSLKQLMKQYPNSASAKGLLAYMQLGLTRIGEPISSAEEQVELAQQALDIDPKNEDALVTQMMIFEDYPNSFEKAEETLWRLIGLYPARSIYFEYMTKFLLYTKSATCEEIQSFLQDYGDGKIAKTRQVQFEFAMLECLNPEAALIKRESIIDNSITALADSAIFENNFFKAKEAVRTNRNPRNIIMFIFFLYHLGEFEDADNLGKKINPNEDGFWSTYYVITSYIYDRVLLVKPMDKLDFITGDGRNRSDLKFSLGLAKQAANENRVKTLKEYIKNVPEFPQTIANIDYSAGLMLLHYHAGHMQESKEIAALGYQTLDQYKQKSAKSYQYHRFGFYSFLFALYSEQFSEAKLILENDLSEEKVEFFGLMGIGFDKFMLSPLAEQEIVQEYYKRIERHRKTSRVKFELD